MPTFTHILAVVWSVAGTAILSALAALIVRQVQHLGITLDQARTQAVLTDAAHAVAYTAEIAATSASKGAPLTSAQKLTTAINYLVDVQPISRDDAVTAIHTTLGAPGSTEGASAHAAVVAVVAAAPAAV